MVFTRKQKHSRGHTKKQEDQLQLVELKPERRTRAIARQGRLDRNAIRQALRQKLLGQRRRHGKMIRLDDEQQLSVVVGQKFSCPICLEFILEPVLTPCGHAFCLPCVEESLRHKTSCCICRHPLTLEDPLSSQMMNRILQAVSARRLEGADAVEYEKRREAFAAKEAERRVGPQVKVGDMVDYYFQRSWQEGQVAAVIEHSQGKTLSIRHPQRDAISCELELNSRLLARFRSFTKQPVIHRSSIFHFDFEDELFNSISNSVYFFLDTPVYHRIEIVEMEAL